MPLLYCSGWSCERMISVSTMPGLNPVALRDPEHFAVEFETCEDCKKTYCDRCVARRSRAFTRARCHQCRGRLRSRAHYERTLSRPWPEAVTRHNAGVKLGEAGRYREALAEFLRAVQLRPEYVSAHYWRAIALRELGRYDEAIDALERVATLDPGHVTALYDLGSVHSRLRRWTDAVHALDRAIAVEPGYFAARVNRAIALTSLGRFDDALTASDAAIRLVKDGRAVGGPPHALAFAHGAKGAALMNLRRYADAVEALDVAVDKGLNNSTTFQNRALALEKLGRFEDARIDRRLAEECRGQG